MESDRVQAGGEDLLCSESGGGVGEAGELDWTRLDSYPPSMMDGSPRRSGRKAKKKKCLSSVSLFPASFVSASRWSFSFTPQDVAQ